MVKARPIIMSGPMVRACLDGTKTQTRRPAGFKFLLGQNPKFTGYTPVHEGGNVWRLYGGIGPATEPLRCPYGQPDDLLWVRETWMVRGCGNRVSLAKEAWPDGWPVSRLQYLASEEPPPDRWVDGRPTAWNVRPSIHMPRWASRLTLRVTYVRVERLQDISEADAEAEGVWSVFDQDAARTPGTTLGCFPHLWDSINGKRAPWDSNPWVFAVSFETIRANVDTVLELAA